MQKENPGRKQIISALDYCTHLFDREDLYELKKCITFIFVKDGEELIANGTGFFLGINVPHNKIHHVYYLVTAKHVLQDINRNFFSKIYLRLNNKANNSAETIEFDLSRVTILMMIRW